MSEPPETTLFYCWIGSEYVLACLRWSWFEMVLSQKIPQILLKHPLWNAIHYGNPFNNLPALRYAQHHRFYDAFVKMEFSSYAVDRWPLTGLRLAKAFLALVSLFLIFFVHSHPYFSNFQGLWSYLRIPAFRLWSWEVQLRWRWYTSLDF